MRTLPEKNKVWEIDWTILWYEFVNWSPPWTYLTKRNFVKSLFIALIMLILSSIDVVFDVFLALEYINGATYLYQFASDSDSKITELNCTFIHYG